MEFFASYNSNHCTQIYIQNEGNIKGNVDINKFGKIDKDFDIGANKYGMAVFKNPKKAFKTLKKKYKNGIKLIQKEFNLPPLSNFTYKGYKTYGWQVTKGSKKACVRIRIIDFAIRICNETRKFNIFLIIKNGKFSRHFHSDINIIRGKIKCSSMKLLVIAIHHKRFSSVCSYYYF